MISIRTSSDVPIHRQIADGLRMSVAAGRLAPGDDIPSVRALATRLGVNPNTVARAYRELERDGVVVTRRGAGTFVARRSGPGAERAVRRAVEDRAAELVTVALQGGLQRKEIIDIVRRELARTGGRK